MAETTDGTTYDPADVGMITNLTSGFTKLMGDVDLTVGEARMLAAGSAAGGFVLGSKHAQNKIANQVGDTGVEFRAGIF